MTIKTNTQAEQEIRSIIAEAGLEWSYELHGNVAAMNRFYKGMVKHPHLSDDWLAHNDAYATACNRTSQIIRPGYGGEEKPVAIVLKKLYGPVQDSPEK